MIISGAIAEEIVSGSPSPTLMVAWSMTEGSGSTAHDSSSLADDDLTLSGATWAGAASPLTDRVTFASGGGVSANHTRTDFSGSTPFTISAWFKTSNVSSEVTLVGSLDPSNNYRGWEFNINGFADTGNISFILINSYPGNMIRLHVPFSASTLYHVVLTYDGTGYAGITIYLNGSAVSPTVDVHTLSGSIASGQNIYVAERKDASNQYSGDVGPIQIWNRVLSAPEVSGLYAAPYSPPA